MKKAAELSYLSGQLLKCANLLREFLLEFPQLADRKRAFICSLLARTYSIQGCSEEAMHFLDEALSLLKEGEDPQLFAELQGDSLYCLTHSGQFSRAEKIANVVLDSLSENEGTSSLEKLYHALCYYYQQRADLAEAIRWEVRSIQVALEQGKLVRCAGRINNLGSLQLEAGKLKLGEKLSRYSLQLAEQMENTELALFAKAILCVHDRKQGQHQAVMRALDELLKMNQMMNQNPHVQAELYIELAKNSNHQFLLEHALSFIQKCKETLQEHPAPTSFVDVTLVLAWAWILLGRPDEALKVISSLSSKKIPRERGRYFLLCAQAHLLLGSLDRAWQAASQAYESFPEYMPYCRARARLSQGEILLAKGRVKSAGRYIEDGLSIAKNEFYFPLMVKGWTLHARWLSATGNWSQARTYCLRALQVAKRVDRPGLRAEVCHRIGKIEAALGNRQSGIQRYTEALQILKERVLHLSPEHRQSFIKQFVIPIENDRNRLLPEGPRAAPRYFIQLRQLANLIREARDQSEIGEKILRIIKESLATISANILLRKFPGGPVHVIASYGHCRQTGKHLLSQSWNGEQLFLPDGTGSSNGGSYSLGVRLGSNKQLLWLLYLERPGQGFSEDEIDFLGCVGSIAEIPLAARAEKSEKGVESGPSLVIDDNRTIVGQHPVMQKLFAEIHRVAATDSTVLIYGESGAGKELVARALHSLSRRRGRFLPINCSALPENLIESELFGHTQGSFTGAIRNQRGLFEAASEGTLFLDEIGAMPVGLQTRLLRVLEDKTVRRLGETKERSVDVRIVAATNQPLTELMRKGKFREDLYHRLNVYQIRVPTLRERVSDIPFLIYHILQGLNRREGEEKGITGEAISLLRSYDFPGNVRELQNIIESSYYLCEGSMISVEDVSWRLEGLPALARAGSSSRIESMVEDLVVGRVDFWRAVRAPFLNRDLSRQDVRKIISSGLEACNGNYRQVVEHFNLPPSDYKKFLAFLSNHNCKVDFRPFRRRPSG
ncbi:sigma 54-interacting transcriptional regulator [Acidobacteria bacterium AH-259-O06]|nr:sigma 54-interacting transcriptional regulator [Acidobacteria bacterium AH-259-O06]